MVQHDKMDDLMPLMLALLGVGLIFVLPAQRAGMTLALLLGGLLGLTSSTWPYTGRPAPTSAVLRWR